MWIGIRGRLYLRGKLGCTGTPDYSLRLHVALPVWHFDRQPGAPNLPMAPLSASRKLEPHATRRLHRLPPTFLTEDGKVRGRPVGVTIDPREPLIVADNLSNTVWRIGVADQAAASN